MRKAPRGVEESKLFGAQAELSATMTNQLRAPAGSNLCEETEGLESLWKVRGKTRMWIAALAIYSGST